MYGQSSDLEQRLPPGRHICTKTQKRHYRLKTAYRISGDDVSEIDLAVMEGGGKKMRCTKGVMEQGRRLVA